MEQRSCPKPHCHTGFLAEPLLTSANTIQKCGLFSGFELDFKSSQFTCVLESPCDDLRKGTTVISVEYRHLH